MTTRNTTETIQELLSLLDDERDLLVAGNYAALSDLAGRQQVLVDSLASDLRPGDIASCLLDRIRKRGEENRRIIEATLAGLREGRVIIAEGTGLRVYDRLGKSRFLGKFK